MPEDIFGANCGVNAVDTESLLSLAVDIARETRIENAFQSIVKGLSEQAEVALVRIWLLRPGDICRECIFHNDCKQMRCLQLIAGSGYSPTPDPQDWSSLERIPLDFEGVADILAAREPMLVTEMASAGLPQPEWSDGAPIRGLSIQPLVFQDKMLGLLAAFSRAPFSNRDYLWLKMFADHAAAAAARATVFDDLKKAEENLLLHNQQLQQVIDAIPNHVTLLERDASARFANRAAREYFGDNHAVPIDVLKELTHPEDALSFISGVRGAVEAGKAFSTEVRQRGSDKPYRWFLYQLVPLYDEAGQPMRWCIVRTDIDEQVRARERAERENLALREEVDRIRMSEEIIGISPALTNVLVRVAKVAQADSTVLITGETGTGKELIARAIHKRSQRCEKAFVSVNCAAIPRDLISSELFGHEKGAFTGASQKRLGRFELAEGGTLFLDEIGELPGETQIALLRVLQEREFQRVGGNQSLRTNVRVIAATHRDLPGAIAAGIFRSDLFYRINVFPIEVPPLRERQEDIRLLVEYFIDRYASKLGKQVRHIEKKSLQRLQSYPWPGNIRELQNVVERSIIVCDSDIFSVDASWLSNQPIPLRSITANLTLQEKELIEAALTESRGKVSGPNGAAQRLQMPASTLESKIKALKINKYHFQTS
jgi:transcriptional regulator with GAF, ATPase, and Fis domain